MNVELQAIRATPFKDPENCKHYAKFASNIDRRDAEIVYWLFFFLVILLLFVTSWYYDRTQDAVEKFSAQSAQHRYAMRNCLYVCCVLGLIALALTILEVFWLMALQFCDGEPLISLYWATWTTVSVGSVIAILGIILAVTHSKRGRKHPPWALALGTPVLVIAGLGHLCHMGVRRRAKSIRSSRRDSRGRADDQNESLSQAPTIRAQSEDPNSRSRRATVVDTGDYNARFLGYTPDGNMIIRFAPSVRLDNLDIQQTRQQSVSFVDALPTPEKTRSSSFSEKASVREGE